MDGLVVPIIVLIVIVVVIAALKVFLLKGGGASLPYEKEAMLFSPAERSFLGVLDLAVGDEFRIMGKVRVADIVKVKSGLERGAKQSAFNRIQSKHVDFVACGRDDLSVQFVVELDDRSHDRSDRKDRDALVDQVMKAAGVPIIHFPVKKAYVIQEVRDVLVRALNPPETVAPPAATANVPVAVTAPSVDQVEPSMGQMADSEICPACGSNMIKRKASKGANAGNEFWGCSAYPKCRQVVAIR